MTKVPSSDFQVTTPETPLLSQQVVTSKGIPNTRCMALKYVTNQLRGSQYATSNTN